MQVRAGNGRSRVALCAVLAAVKTGHSGGCSFATVVRYHDGRPQPEPCTRSVQAPVGDAVAALLLGAAGGLLLGTAGCSAGAVVPPAGSRSSGDDCTGLKLSLGLGFGALGLAALALASSTYGFITTSTCRAHTDAPR